MQTHNNDIILFTIGTTIIFLFLLSFIAAVLFLYQKRSILYFKQLEDVKNDYEKSLLQTQLEIQEQTFQDISREIHDNIGLSLTLAKLQLNTLDFVRPHNTKENVESSIDLLSKAISDLSHLSKSFNSESIKEYGLYNALKAESEKIRRSGKHRVNFIETGDSTFLDANKELILYRIAQEALNNILKHANATEISLKLVYDTLSVTLSIEDNGQGFDNNPLNFRTGEIHTGLNNIRMRAQTLNGNCQIKSQINSGTLITIKAPY